MSDDNIIESEALSKCLPDPLLLYDHHRIPSKIYAIHEIQERVYNRKSGLH